MQTVLSEVCKMHRVIKRLYCERAMVVVGMAYSGSPHPHIIYMYIRILH